MAKRRITVTVTVDEELVSLADSLGEQDLSALVSAALAGHLERLARQPSLRSLLDEWEAEAGPVPDALRADAAAAFDEADGSAW